MVLSLLAALCAGAFVLLITGLMGMPGLCSLVGHLVWVWLGFLVLGT
jgi:hypothetical protein